MNPYTLKSWAITFCTSKILLFCICNIINIEYKAIKKIQTPVFIVYPYKINLIKLVNYSGQPIHLSSFITVSFLDLCISTLIFPP